MPDLKQYRDDFIAQVKRYVPHSGDQQCFTEVLDDFIAWSLLRPSVLGHHDGDYDQHVVSFARLADGAVFWSAYPRRHDGAKFEILPRMSKALTTERRQDALAVIRSVSRESVSEKSTLRIPFQALKSPATRQRVTALLDRLLANVGPHP